MTWIFVFFTFLPLKTSIERTGRAGGPDVLKSKGAAHTRQSIGGEAKRKVISIRIYPYFGREVWLSLTFFNQDLRVKISQESGMDVKGM